MGKKPKLTFATILHLSEMYCDQYNERGLCLSSSQNETLFRDFVWQYTSTLYWKGKEIVPFINLELISY